MSDYHALRDHYEGCLEAHGDTHLGVGWPRQVDAERRYEAMLGMVPRAEAVSLLDLGCGAAHLVDYLRATGRDQVAYTGADISAKFVALAREKHPDLPFHVADLLAADAPDLGTYDYVVMNGIFTARNGMSFDAMWAFCQALLDRAVPLARRGLAFNVMSKHVDWERDDLFHLPYDTLAGFLHARGWRRYTLRAEDGLYDYTVYIHRGEAPWPSS